MSGNLATVLLRHRWRGRSHFDWLIDAPPDPESNPWGPAPGATGSAGDHARALRAWRLQVPPWQWSQYRIFPLVPLDPHRRRYLNYQGPVAGDRGQVWRVDCGTVVVSPEPGSCWLLRVELKHFRGRLRLHRGAEGAWRAEILGAGPIPRACWSPARGDL
ncbi:MAG: hypothetical protein OER86_06355 [Phycisphaerae bacterium]|nr:hypothetical protein [Phycisphaerae bacterium]